MLKAVGNNLIIDELNKKDVAKDGLILTSYDEFRKGKVISISDDNTKGDYIKEGDIVYFKDAIGNKTVKDGGKDYIIVNVQEVLSVDK